MTRLPRCETVELAPGTRLDLWVRAGARPGPGLEIRAGGRTVYRIPTPARHVEHYHYDHPGGPAEIGWDPEALEVTFAYSHHPDTVAEAGITLWEVGADGLRRSEGAAITRDGRPGLHLSPPRGWMNDPNGACFVGDRWHLFYQFHPGGTGWGPMHWGHATSRDLLHWTHLPVFLHPEQNLGRLGASGGAFSGSACAGPEGLSLYYTERRPGYHLTEGYTEVQKRVWPDDRLLAPERVRTVLTDRPDGVAQDFRDPKVWWDEGAVAYRMVLGAAVDGCPAVLLFGSDDGTGWRSLGTIWRAEPRFRADGARAAECPDLFRIDGTWVLIVGLIGHVDPGSGRRDPLFAVTGDFDGTRFSPTGAPQHLDFGAGLYAMQTAERDGRRIAFAWMPDAAEVGPSPLYRGEMGLPREVGLATGRLCLPFAREALADEAWQPASVGPVPDAPLRLELAGPLDGTRIEALADGRVIWSVTVADGRAEIVLPQATDGIRRRSERGAMQALTLMVDRWLVEAVFDGGRIAGSVRSVPAVAPDVLRVESGAEVRLFTRADAYSCR